MELKGNLCLVYNSMDHDRVRTISSFLGGLRLTVVDNGFDGSGELSVGVYRPNNAFFCLTPKDKRVGYDGIGNLSSRIYNVSFHRTGHEGEIVDELFVGFSQGSYTGIFLRTGPVIFNGDKK